MGSTSKRKGKVGERELAAELSRLFRVECRRGQQYNGLEGQDVVGLPGIHVECKRVESLRLYPAIEQAKTDAAGRVPLVCHRANGREWVAIVPLEQLPALAERLYLTLAENG